MQIREMVQDDYKAIKELSGQLGYKLSLSDTQNQIRSVLADKDNCAFVAIQNEKVIGWIHAFKAIRIETRAFIEIGGLVIDENYRGKGIGKHLVTKARQWAADKGCQTLRVRSNTKRKEAHMFYLHLNFHETKEQKVFEMEI